MPAYKAVGSVSTTVGQTTEDVKIIAPTDERAIEKAKVEFERDRDTLRAVYKEWEYTYTGGLTGETIYDERDY